MSAIFKEVILWNIADYRLVVYCLLYILVGVTMLTLGIQKVRERGYKGITVEGDYNFYNRVGFRTSSEYGIYPTSGYSMTEPRCMMCQETEGGSLKGHGGYVVYDMYYNA